MEWTKALSGAVFLKGAGDKCWLGFWLKKEKVCGNVTVYATYPQVSCSSWLECIFSPKVCPLTSSMKVYAIVQENIRTDNTGITPTVCACSEKYFVWDFRLYAQWNHTHTYISKICKLVREQENNLMGRNVVFMHLFMLSQQTRRFSCSVFVCSGLFYHS